MSTRDVNRRVVLKRMLQGATWLGISPLLGKQAFAQTGFSGKFLLTVQIDGGWDVSSFCDPKANVAGEKEINTWARTRGIGTVGNLRYAPFGGNQKFFEKYYDRMLVINGVDMQTNSHDTGKITTWSGRLAQGYPSLTAMYAATHAPDKALSYLAMGGWGNTEGIINSTRIDNITALESMIYPNNFNNRSGTALVSNADFARITALQQKVMQRKMAEEGLLPQDALNRADYALGMSGVADLKALGELIPTGTELQRSRSVGGLTNYLHARIQTALLAFKSGLCVAADVVDPGFDTHETHDSRHEPLLANAVDAIDYLWTYAEQLGIADRLLVVIGSDFSRTPYYNSNQGKDHWNIGSYVFMEKGRAYTNRVVGETDGAQNAKKISAATLKRDDSRGTQLLTGHIHKALRTYLGLAGTAYDRQFPLSVTEDFNFFVA